MSPFDTSAMKLSASTTSASTASSCLKYLSSFFTSTSSSRYYDTIADYGIDSAYVSGVERWIPESAQKVYDFLDKVVKKYSHNQHNLTSSHLQRTDHLSTATTSTSMKQNGHLNAAFRQPTDEYDQNMPMDANYLSNPHLTNYSHNHQHSSIQPHHENSHTLTGHSSSNTAFSSPHHMNVQPHHATIPRYTSVSTPSNFSNRYARATASSTPTNMTTPSSYTSSTSSTSNYTNMASPSNPHMPEYYSSSTSMGVPTQSQPPYASSYSQPPNPYPNSSESSNRSTRSRANDPPIQSLSDFLGSSSSTKSTSVYASSNPSARHVYDPYRAQKMM